MTGIDPEMIQAADELSASLAELFRRGGWSHHRLAGEAGLSPATVLAIVNGSTGIPRSGTLTAFVRACGQDPAPWIAARGRAVQAAKARGPGKFPGARLVPWRTGVFVGRGEELARLDRALGRRGGVVVHVIHGLGGIGKSALAAEYARTRADRYDLVWWCSADSAAQVEAGLAALAGALWPEAGHGAAGELAERALQWLASQDRWLLVLDNVTSPADVQPLLARARSGRLLLTSRLGTGWHQVTSSVTRLEVLPEGEATVLLARIAAVGRPDAVLDGAGELCTWLGCLPLAIEQAAGYLQQNSLSPREYLALLAGRPAAMLDQMPQGSDPQRTIARIWRVTLDRLADVPLACHLLRVLAWWAPRPIPRSLPGALADPSALQQALGALAAYNMITLEPEAIAVHRLVQAVARTPDPGDPHRQEADISYARGHAAGLLAQAAPESPQDPGGWPAWRSLLPHIDNLITHAPPETDTFVTCRLLSQATAFLLRQRTASQAISYAQRTLDGARRLYGPDHPDTLVASNQLAHARKAAGDLPTAITLYEQVLASHRRILGPGHSETLMCSNNLARAYRAAGDLERAIPLFEQTAVACDRILGASHPQTLTLLTNLADAYEAAGDLEQAIPLYDRTLADRKRILGPDHPDTLVSRISLAGAYETAGDPQRAIPLYEQAIADLERVLGPDHPDTLSARVNLAYTCKAAGDPQRAIALYHQAIPGLRHAPGADHPLTLVAQSNLASAYESTGDLAQAVSLYKETLASQERVLGPAHPETLITRANLAGARAAVGDLDQAAEIYQQARADCERALGAGHPQTLAIRIRLADIYETAGNLDQAIELYEQAHADCQRVLGASHPTTLECASDLAYTYHSAGDLTRAIALYEHTLPACERVLGPDHPGTLRRSNCLAYAYQCAGDPQRAIPMHKRILAAQERVLGPDHLDTLTSLNNLAGACMLSGDTGQAIPLFKQAHTGHERALGPSHPDTLRILANLAAAHVTAGDLQHAATLYRQALPVCEQVLGDSHPLTLTIRLALLLYGQGSAQDKN